MPYQGSAQSVGFRNRTVIDPSKRMREEAQLIQEQGRERLRGMETQASQVTQEMQRVSELQDSNARYELQALGKFSKTINDFMQDVVVEEAKKRNEEQFYEGVRAFELEGQQGNQQASQEVDQALKKSEDVHVKANELASKIPDEDAAQRVRSVSKAYQNGYNMAALNSAGQGFAEHLLAERETNTTQLIDPASGKPFILKDAKGPDQFEAAVQYLKSEYIKKNNPSGLSAKVIATKLVPQLNQAIQLQRKEYIQKYRRETAINDLDSEENRLHNSLMGMEGFVDAPTAIQNYLKITPAIFDRLGVPEGGQRAARNFLSKTLQDIIKNDPNKVDSVIQTLQGTKIEGHPAGAKTLVELYGDEFNPVELRAMAQQARIAKYNTQQTEEKMRAQEAFDATLEAFQKGTTDIERLSLIKEFSNNFPSQVGLISQLSSWEPAVLGVDASEAKMLALKAQYGGEIPKSEVKNLDPAVLTKYKNDIVETPFGSGDKEAIKDGQRIVTAAIKEARKITTNEAVMYDDAIRAERVAHGMIMPLARRIFKDAQAAGAPISHGEAIRRAAGDVADRIEAAQDNPKDQFYSESGRGFTKFEKEVGATNVDRALAAQKTDYRRAQLLLKKNSNALVTEKVIKNPADLELTISGTPKPFIYALAKLDGRRTAFEILNAQRSKSGLGPVKLPKQAQSLQNVLDRFPEVKRAYTSYPSYNTINRGLETIGTISPSNLLKAVSSQESGGNYQAYNADSYGPNNPALGKYQILWSTALDWSRRAGMPAPRSKQAFLNNPQYQEALARWAIGEYIRQASQRTKDPKIAIRMAAAMWYGGAGNINSYNDTKKQAGGYPSFREYTTSILNKYLGGS